MRRALVVAICTLAVTACGSSSRPTGSTRPTRSTAAPVAATTSSTRDRVTTTIRAAPTTTGPIPTTVPATGATLAGQRVTVHASSYGPTTATVTAYQHTTAGWTPVLGPWLARVGRNGVAPPGAKREGDGRTPSGTYGFQFFFGIRTDPGVKFQYRAITPTIVWDDDPASANYNRWIDTRAADAGRDPEPMYNAPVYNYGAVVAYNTARTAPLGSAIFLAVAHGAPTAGCIALPVDQLVELLRWLDPRQSPTIAISVG